MSAGAALFDRPLLALDMEMSGLNPQRDRILSIGCVPITAEGIPLGQAQYWLLHSDMPVSQSAAIHHLRDMDLAQEGHDPERLLPQLMARWKDAVLVTHGGELDAAFLYHAHRRYCGKPWRPQRLDTQVFAQKRLTPDLAHDGRQVSLRYCRQQHRLPPWRAHHALSDAIATAELFLAQLRSAFPQHPDPEWTRAYKCFSNVWMRWGWR